jgi:membrane protease subunit HflC
MLQNKMMLGALGFSIALILMMSIFTVQETELAIKLRLGKVVKASYAPGLHLKRPLIETIRFFDKRIQTLDAIPAQFLTAEKKNLIVDSFVKWKIAEREEDLINYYKTVGGNAQRAGQRLSELIADGLRSKFGKRTVREVVSGDRAEIMTIITKEAQKRAKQFGIDIVDVRVKRIELPKEVSSSVYRRMEAERERVARDLRSQGEAEAIRIRAGADRKSIEIMAEAERESEQIRGVGEALTTQIYAQAFQKNSEFYAYYRSINAYRNVFNDKRDIFLIQPDSAFFNYFNQFHHETITSSPSQGAIHQQTPMQMTMPLTNEQYQQPVEPFPQLERSE